MIETLESKVPLEVASIIFRFLKHPTAELLEPLIMTYDYRSMHWAMLCKSNHPSMHLAHKFVFPLSVFTDIQITKGRKQGKQLREILLG